MKARKVRGRISLGRCFGAASKPKPYFCVKELSANSLELKVVPRKLFRPYDYVRAIFLMIKECYDGI